MFLKNYKIKVNISALLLLSIGIVLTFFMSCKDRREPLSIAQDTTVVEVDTLSIIAEQIDAALKHDQLDELFRNKAYLNGFNGNVLVAQRGVIVYQQCFGYCNYESKDSLNADSKFQIASLSKTFTAVAVLKLMEEGKLKLTDLVTQYFPELPFKKVTIAMLLSHRSGIANYVNVYDDKVIKENLYPTNEELMKWMKKFKRRYISTPNKYFEYSNTNYVLLAAIIEKVSGETYNTYMHKYIFDPLNMKDTWVITDSNSAAFQNRTTSYSPLWQRKDADYFDKVVGDKGIFSTVNDLYKWYDGLVNYKILRQETIDSAWMPRSKEKKGIKNYGYGFRMLCYNDTTKIIYHNGWWNSYNSLFYINPKLKYVIIVLGNKFNNDIYNIQSASQIMNEAKSDEDDKLE